MSKCYCASCFQEIGYSCEMLESSVQSHRYPEGDVWKAKTSKWEVNTDQISVFKICGHLVVGLKEYKMYYFLQFPQVAGDVTWNLQCFTPPSIKNKKDAQKKLLSSFFLFFGFKFDLWAYVLFYSRLLRWRINVFVCFVFFPCPVTFWFHGLTFPPRLRLQQLLQLQLISCDPKDDIWWG